MNTKPGTPSTHPFPLRSTLLLVGVFFITFIGRTSLSPLLLPIERELGISHAEGGSFFLVISVGLMLTMLFSGMVSQRLKHHTTIALSAVLTGAALILMAVAGSLFWFRVGLFFLGAGAGLYLPSGVTTLTDVVPSGQWGRAIALHELGPIFGLAAAPILADIALPFFNWQILLFLLGIISLLTGAVFARYAEGGRFYGTPPKWAELYGILKKRQFWIIAFFFIMAIGLEMGVYSMLPSYLVADRGIDPSLVNRMVSTSRLTSLLMIFAAGWLSDHLGYKTVIAGTALISGILTALIGFAHGWLLISAVYLQPMLVSAFFPAGFTAMAGVSSSAQRNLSVSMVIPLAYLFGGGVFPSMIGWLAERGAFGLGFVVVGILMAAGILLVPALKSTAENES
ncbi:MAG: MFS transporter [Spirochaetia bacterium]|nr:MFS transporter [Spirochaetia bacterium]